MKPGFFVVFLLPPIAIACFLRGGAWTWAFVPVLAGLGAAELATFAWNRSLRRAATRGPEGALASAEETK